MVRLLYSPNKRVGLGNIEHHSIYEMSAPCFRIGLWRCPNQWLERDLHNLVCLLLYYRRQ